MKSTGPTTAASGGTSQAYRPTTQSGRPVSGVVRPGSQAGQGGMDTALRTPRTAKTARPVSAASGRHVRVGTGEFYHEFNSPLLGMVHTVWSRVLACLVLKHIKAFSDLL